ncbi:MAG TPA: enoyl-CoA hydratase/isomerase family protein [Pseudorhodoferax sp.]|jgi:enoyl-CoA hydratase/carnithine racemase|nr:enoyl-CoA hydratase/isomerase family protein [Pseudorhodoferax sp.]
MSPLAIDHQDGCTLLTLERADKANALSAELVEALLDAVAQAAARGARVLVLRGAGRNFSAGFDFSDQAAQSEGDLLLRFVRIEVLLQAVAASGCLTLGLAHGRNFGAGVDLFAACQWRVCDPDATFRMPGLAFGLVLGTRRFGQIVGAERARDILESSTTFDAEQAQALGFVRRVVSRARWQDEIDAALRCASVLPPPARAGLYRALAADAAVADASLADLVRSASAPGLKARVQAYLAAQSAARGKKDEA